MKKVIFGIFFILASVTSAQASLFYSVHPNRVAAEVCNDFSPYIVQCQTTVFGYYPNGTYVYSTANLPLLPGTCNYAYVYNYSYAPFVNGNAAVRCF